MSGSGAARGSGMDRRARMLERFRQAAAPVTGTELSATLGVSRQAIVNDVAILRASGQPVVGSPQGYVLAEDDGAATVAIACRHDRDDSRVELETLVDCGLTVLDVVVEHPLYGEVRANLRISSLSDVDRYMHRLDTEDAQPLSALTGGVHLHHVTVPSPDALAKARAGLEELGILLTD